jgi:hypothetical protein
MGGKVFTVNRGQPIEKLCWPAKPSVLNARYGQCPRRTQVFDYMHICNNAAVPAAFECWRTGDVLARRLNAGEPQVTCLGVRAGRARYAVAASAVAVGAVAAVASGFVGVGS